MGRLQRISSTLSQLNVRNTYRIVMVESNVTVFKPRGLLEEPKMISELFTALRNILEALVVLHGCHKMHRDIRWPNVMKRVNSTGWFLIEFDSMVSSPQRSESVPEHLSTDEHAPEMSQHEHTAAVDIWSVGFLIMSSAVPWEERRCLFSFAQWLMRDRFFDRPEGAEVLAKLLELEKAETAKTQERKTDKEALAWF
ncbi:hypothetical protein Poli38472_012342 [Pythium oligandrum]|uniref:Protein kinase domain-containing protein n=1 Tax=Pythium oligandrum TaxID=41045 RepID=A0A8K1CRA0_PYTOL|nr:hypothetical protein Poli38472_012342 [Pythium oligandrum]|eukprot:TMW67226.1 hypothetical protein Poli38472_012342 [Pythium oligandrum]